MDTREFVDQLYRLWAQTTDAEKGIWILGESEGVTDIQVMRHEDDDRPQVVVANAFDSTDAQFISTIHGALPQLIRVVHDALDEADRLDQERDQIASELLEVSRENERLQADLACFE